MNIYETEILPLAKHYGYTLKHKWNIIGPGRELGLGYGRLLKHDLDKLWDVPLARSYGKYFFGPDGIKGNNDPELYDNWRGYVQKHYERSPHHDHKLGKPKSMESTYETIADVYSLLKTTGQTTLPFDEWYQINRGRFF